MIRLLLWFIVFVGVLGIETGCSFNPDRVQMTGVCPYYSIDAGPTTQLVNFTFFNGTQYVTEVRSRTSFSGRMGWCGSHDYPRDVTGITTGTIGATEHSYIMTIPDAWCHDVYIFFNCLARRPTAWHPPPYAINVRPLVSHCGDVSATGMPLWDIGGYYYRSITVRINDTCADFSSVPARLDSRSNYLVGGFNTSYAFGTPPVPGPAVYLSSRVAECQTTDIVSILTPECTVCHKTCALMPTLRCDEPVRTRPITTYESIVELACHDPDYGFVWKVTNVKAPGLHYDWVITRANDTSLVDAAHGNGIVVPVNTNVRNAFFDDPFENSFWPGTSGKHTAETGHHFYIPTWIDLVGNMTGDPYRVSTLDLYAGAPSHYVGSTTVGALVALFDLNTLMQLDELDAMMGSPFQFSLVPTPTFPGDMTRQSLLYICGTPGLPAMAAFYASSGSQNWVPFCAAVMLPSTTWSAMFNLTLTTFALPSASDPMPTCACTNAKHNCGDGAVTDPFRLQYDYRQTSNRTIDAVIEPVCRMPIFGEMALNVNNLPPLTYLNGSSTPVVYNVTNASLVSAYLSGWPEPQETIVAMPINLFNFSISPFGVLWRFTNQNIDPLAAGMTVRMAIGNLNMTDGIYELPRPFTAGEEIIIQPNRTRWIFSRTLIDQRIYGNINWPCIVGGCPEGAPSDPQDDSTLSGDVLSSSTFQFLNITLYAPAIATLPPCICHVNAPCDGLTFLLDTPSDVNVSALAPAPTAPLPPPTVVPLPGCIPEIEVCDCFDNNCDGFVDNVIGVNATCGFSNVGRCSFGNLYCNISVCNISIVNVTQPLVCVGFVTPEAERCDGQDWDCDGIPNNVIHLGQPCGSTIGVCQKGTWQCMPPAPDPVCVGGVQPAPSDICGDGLDNDCNGLIDDNCTPAPGPTSSPSPLPSPSPSPPIAPVPTPAPTLTPTPTPTPVLPPPTAIPAFGSIDLASGQLPVVIGTVVFLGWITIMCLWCCRRRLRMPRSADLAHPFGEDAEMLIYKDRYKTYRRD